MRIPVVDSMVLGGMEVQAMTNLRGSRCISEAISNSSLLFPVPFPPSSMVSSLFEAFPPAAAPEGGVSWTSILLLHQYRINHRDYSRNSHKRHPLPIRAQMRESVHGAKEDKAVKMNCGERRHTKKAVLVHPARRNFSPRASAYAVMFPMA